MKLSVESLEVSSFATGSYEALAPLPTPMCCTGCDSGCGINPTALTCESDGGGDKTIAELEAAY